MHLTPSSRLHPADRVEGSPQILAHALGFLACGRSRGFRDHGLPFGQLHPLGGGRLDLEQARREPLDLELDRAPRLVRGLEHAMRFVELDAQPRGLGPRRLRFALHTLGCEPLGRLPEHARQLLELGRDLRRGGLRTLSDDRRQRQHRRCCAFSFGLNVQLVPDRDQPVWIAAADHFAQRPAVHGPALGRQAAPSRHDLLIRYHRRRRHPEPPNKTLLKHGQACLAWQAF